MPKTIALAIFAASLSAHVAAQNPQVWLDTDHGPIIVELDEASAPITTENFLAYVNEGFYDGIIFHRVIDGFVIQSGGFDRDFRFREPTRENILNEADNGLLNVPGTIAMARSDDRDSANSQFYFNTGENDFLDGDFAVFGEIIVGMETVESIQTLRTGSMSFSQTNSFGDAPASPPVIRRAIEVDGFPIMPLHTGSWFDPANPGVGFNVEVANDASTEDGPLLLVYWYDFSDNGQLWLLGIASFEFGASEVTLDMLTHPGMGDGIGFLNPPPIDTFESWGTLTVRFEDCRTGRFSYQSPQFGSGELTVDRLTLPDQASCEFQ